MFPILRRMCSRKTFKILYSISRHENISKLYKNVPTTHLCAIISPNNLQNIRYKSKKSKIPQQEITESEPEESSNDESLDTIQNKHSKIIKINVGSQRVDALLKAALGISRNKIDVMFYENRIRVNGEKLPKKNVHYNDGDEVDLIKTVSPTNPDHLIVARVEVISVAPEDEKVTVKIRRFKSLAVENYPGLNSWKG